jgi:hypothetical protein
LSSSKSFVIFPCRFLEAHISPAITGELHSHHQQSPVPVVGIHTTGCCPVPRRDRLRHCCHHLSAMQPCLTPWLRWTRALFAVLGRYTPTPRDEDIGLIYARNTCMIPQTLNNEINAHSLACSLACSSTSIRCLFSAMKSN